MIEKKVIYPNKYKAEFMMKLIPAKLKGCFTLVDNEVLVHIENDNLKVCKLITSIIYAELINKHLSKDLNKLIDDEYFSLNNDMEEVKKEIGKLIRLGNIKKLGIETNFHKSLLELVSEMNSIDVQSILVFRYRLFKDEFEKIMLEPIIHNLLVNKEHTEFLKLLKYFTDTSEPVYDEVFLSVNKLNEYTLIDNDSNNLLPLFEEEMKVTKMDYSEDLLKTEDIIMAGLVSKVPKTLKIENSKKLKEKDEDFFNSLTMVFNTEII